MASTQDETDDPAALTLRTRRALGVTAQEMGFRMRVNKATIWRWEHGRSAPSYGEQQYMRSLLTRARARG